MTLIMSEGGLIQFHSRCNFGQSTRNVKRSSRSIQSRPLWDHFFVDEQHQDHHTLQKSVLNKMINFNREALVICESKLCTTWTCRSLSVLHALRHTQPPHCCVGFLGWRARIRVATVAFTDRRVAPYRWERTNLSAWCHVLPFHYYKARPDQFVVSYFLILWLSTLSRNHHLSSDKFVVKTAIFSHSRHKMLQDKKRAGGNKLSANMKLGF